VLAPAAAAQAPRADRAAVGTLIVGHGGGPEWNARVEEVAREVRLPGPVGVSLLMGPGAAAHRFQDVVRDLEARRAREIVVVPLLASSHSGHYEQIAYLAGKRDTLDSTMAHHLGMSGITRPDSAVPMRMAAGMNDAPEIAGILAERARSLAKSPGRQSLLLLGHGPNSGR
jgi:sirohydrochlorin cobaltochelatase